MLTLLNSGQLDCGCLSLNGSWSIIATSLSKRLPPLKLPRQTYA